MNTAHIQSRTAPLVEQIIAHPLYESITTIEDVKGFMQYHVYAVWDFMSLLKSLQQQLTCTSIPWFPVGDAATRFLINEIVVGEESDVDIDGTRKSHFEMYIDAMQQCGADTEEIATFINALKNENTLTTAFTIAGTPQAAKDFVQSTFDTIATNKAYVQAAVFTFGREDLIPGMFMSMIRDIDERFPATISKYRYYLERHIEVDGGHHSHLASAMTTQLCGSNATYWQEAEAAVVTALQQRLALWDGAYQRIMERKRITTLA